MLTLTIIIVNYNTGNLLKQCLESFEKFIDKKKVKILVIDNNSHDNSLSSINNYRKAVKITKNSKNRFYTYATNQGLLQVNSKYFLILNPDTILTKTTISKMIMFMESYPDCGLASCRQINTAGKLNRTCHKNHSPLVQILELSPLYKLFKHSKVVNEFHYGKWDRKSVKEVDTIPGSFIFGRKSVIDKIGILDKNLAHFFSDADFCKRAGKAGIKIYHNGNVTIKHMSSGSSHNSIESRKLIYRSYKDMYLYYLKHHGVIIAFIISVTTRISLLFVK